MVKYKLTDLELGQTAIGTADCLSKLIKIPKQSINVCAREEKLYKKRYQIVKLGEEEDSKSMLVYRQWDEVHKIYTELAAGERRIVKNKDGKRYAIKIKAEVASN